MLCQNCGKNEVNFRYTQVINGEKREIALCDKCAKKLGLESLDFSREIEDLFNMSFAESFLPSFARTNMLGSRNLGTIFNNDIFVLKIPFIFVIKKLVYLKMHSNNT